MKTLSFLLIVAVSVLNVALNLCLKKTTAGAVGIPQAWLSWGFIGCLFIGLLSFSGLFALYSTGITLSRGILMMGAISILGGSLYGVVFFKERLQPVEWGIFLLLTLLIIYRWFYKA